ncbi:MAG TPA: LTA synthase family protein [Candidatus Woesebacteria bacterium]|nr:LTA synthase family protein [Candidatus Woesebacteria bacterium]
MIKKISPFFTFFIPFIFSFLSQRLVIGRGYEFTQNNISIILINYVLWLGIYLFFISIFKKNYQSIFGFLIFFIIFTLANRYKSKLLNQPVTANDFYLLKNLLIFLPDIFNQPNIKKELIASVIALFFFFFAIKKIFYFQNPSIKIKLFLLPLSIFILTFSFFFPNKFNLLISDIGINPDVSNPMNSCKQNGALFCFYDDLKKIKNPAPKNYNQSTIQQIYSNIKLDELYKLDELSTKPNIIVVLSEALWDPTLLSNVKITQDPIKNIRPDIKSTLISPTYGGGTANVEFEIATGLSAYFLTGKIAYSQSIRQDMPSIFSLFEENGYSTAAIHPFVKSTYNRTTVYKHFGVDKFIGVEDMKNYEKAGPFVSDKSFAQEIIKQLNSTDQPQFIFTLSMQNHFPFEADRFSEHPIDFSSNLDTESHKSLQSYIDGINLSDKSYQDLKTEIEKSKKPTILIVYGDHLPLLGDDFDIYKKTGFYQDNDLKMYSTPVAIWSNFKTNLDLPKLISPNFLSLEILKLAQIKPKYQYSFLESIEKTDTVLKQNFSTKLTKEQLENYELIQYDLVSGKKYGIK